MVDFKQFTDFNSNIYTGLFSLTLIVLWLAIGYAFFTELVYTDGLHYVYAASTIVLSAALALKWRDMDSPAGVTWRRILAVGTLILLATTISISTKNFQELTFIASVFYWMAVPGYGFKIIADFSDGDSSFFILQSHLASFLTMFFLLGTLTDSQGFQALTAVVAAISHSSAAYTYLKN